MTDLEIERYRADEAERQNRELRDELRLVAPALARIDEVRRERDAAIARAEEATLEAESTYSEALDRLRNVEIELLQIRADSQIDGRAMRMLLGLPSDATAQDMVDKLMGVVSEASLWRAYHEGRTRARKVRITVRKYTMDESASWEERYAKLEAHHAEETTFLVAACNEANRECEELARRLDSCKAES